MATKFLSPEAQFRAGVNVQEPAVKAEPAPAAKVDVPAPAPQTAARPQTEDGLVSPKPPSGEGGKKGTEFAAMQNQEDAPPCSTCGSIMIRSGSCYKCANCGTTSGCA
jgi:ribonucleoside-diphosphate reductase alpha chain